MSDDILISAKALQNLLIEMATGGNRDRDKEFDKLRNAIVLDKTIASKIPAFLHEVRSCRQFWGFIQPQYSSYAERKQYIYAEFQPLLRYLENKKAGLSETPHDDFVKSALLKLSSKHVLDEWKKALKGREEDPENAITMARTLIESTCKSILDEADIDNDKIFDIRKLYEKVAEYLKLNPEQHNEQIFKQILGGCIAVVGGLAALRNSKGDAHGKGKGKVKPEPRHAELAVNLSGAMASFLVETWEKARSQSGQSNTY